MQKIEIIKALKTRALKPFIFGYIPTYSILQVWFRRYIFILKVLFQFTRRKQENKDLFIDIAVDLIIYQLILVIKPFLGYT